MTPAQDTVPPRRPVGEYSEAELRDLRQELAAVVGWSDGPKRTLYKALVELVDDELARRKP